MPYNRTHGRHSAGQQPKVNNMKQENRNEQMIKACPFPINAMQTLRVKLSTDKGQTKWLNLTPKEYKLIELVLCGVITDEQ